LNEVSGLLIVPTKTTSTVILDRGLPASVVMKQLNGYVYSLDIRKQPGISQLPFRLIVILPKGASIDPAGTNASLTNNGEGWVWEKSIVDTSTNIQISFN